jgi:hypothetical protein
MKLQLTVAHAHKHTHTIMLQDALLLEARALRHRSYTPYPLAGGGYKRSWVRALRKQAAAATGVHSFWDETAGLRKLRKVAADRSGMHGFFSGKRHYDFSGTAGSSFDVSTPHPTTTLIDSFSMLSWMLR